METAIAHGKTNPYAMPALFVTIDCPYLGRRLDEFRNQPSLLERLKFSNIFPGIDVANLEDGDQSMAYDDEMEWSEIIPFFRKHTNQQI
ncbi:hypothetical protein BJX76DRAFT_361972 [Aspergillus varians]